MKLLILLFCLPVSVLAQDNYSTLELKEGKYKADSSYIYTLPFEHGKKSFLVQAYEGMFSHKGGRALDFKIKTGTKVCAARSGVVTAVRNDSDKGGLKPENLSDGNYIAILHSDGSTAWYWHFQKDGVVVETGDKIETGQFIGLSGNTGYSAFPHLHFEVQGTNASGVQTQLPTRFYTHRGVIYLSPGRFYRSLHQ